MCFTLEMPRALRGTGRSAAIATAAQDRHYRTRHRLGNAMHLSNICAVSTAVSAAVSTITRRGTVTP